MQDLFRQEAVEHQRAKWVGKALLISGTPAWIIATLSLFFFIVLVLFLIFCNYTRKVNIYGEIVTNPRPVNLFSPQQGFISESFVNVGDVVKKGQSIYQLDVSRVTNSGKVSATTRIALNNQLLQIDAIINKLESNKKIAIENIKNQKAKYEVAYEQSRRVLDNAYKGVEFAKKNMQSYEEYQQRGLITKDQLINQTYSYYQQQNIFQNLYSENIQESLQIASLESDIVTKAADFDNQISQFQFQKNELKKNLAEVDASETLIISSPADGRIESLSVTPGQMVSIGDSLAQLIPKIDPAYYLVLWVPNNSIPYISVGDAINIRYDAFPFEKFGQFHGDIESIAYVPASSQEMMTYNSSPAYQTAEPKEAYYKIMVSLERNTFKYQSKKLKLSSGMRAKSTLFLERRPLYQWMFSPFYDIKKSLEGPAHE